MMMYGQMTAWSWIYNRIPTHPRAPHSPGPTYEDVRRDPARKRFGRPQRLLKADECLSLKTQR